METHKVQRLAGCSLLSDYASYLKLFFPTPNQVLSSGSLSVLAVYPQMSMSAKGTILHIFKWQWLNSLFILGTIGTPRYQSLCEMKSFISYSPAYRDSLSTYKVEHITQPLTFTGEIKSKLGCKLKSCKNQITFPFSNKKNVICDPQDKHIN